MKIRLFRIAAAAVLTAGALGLSACGGGFQCDDVAPSSASVDVLADDDCGDDDD